MVGRNGEKWQKAEDVNFVDETVLQKMLHERPQLVSGSHTSGAVSMRTGYRPDAPALARMAASGAEHQSTAMPKLCGTFSDKDANSEIRRLDSEKGH